MVSSNWARLGDNGGGIEGGGIEGGGMEGGGMEGGGIEGGGIEGGIGTSYPYFAGPTTPSMGCRGRSS